MENKLIPIDDKIIEDISTKLSEYLDLKDLIFENEFVESFGDAFKVVGLLKTGHKLISQRKLNYFLKGFCYDDTPTDEQLLKLNKYIDNEKKAEFIADMFSKIIMSNSKLACMVMGIMINDLTSDDKEITHNQLICANALTNFFDFDIIYFYKIVTCIKPTYSFYAHEFIDNDLGYEYHKSDGGTGITLDKSVTHQLFSTYDEINIDTQLVSEPYFGNDVNTSSEHLVKYSISNTGKLLFSYIEKISSHLE